MLKVYIYGRGVGYGYLRRCLNTNIDIVAYIDNYSLDKTAEDGRPIITIEEIDKKIDYIIISIIKYELIKEELIKKDISASKIISFFDESDADNYGYGDIIDNFKWKTELLWKYKKEVVEPAIRNIPFELNYEYLLKKKEIPSILSVKDTIDEILIKKKSVVRFGDGEFSIIDNRIRPRFQTINESLSAKLKVVLCSKSDRVLICIADNYGELNQYTDEAAAGIRLYLTNEVRRNHMMLLDMHRTYGNAYLSRPYFIYRNKEKSVITEKFEHIKKIWDKQDVLIIEGEHTRFGVGNDLLDNAASVNRILVPDKNAFDYYDDILKVSQINANGRLVLSIIGPTATVLSYDLAMSGFWAIDIGQLDSEYEWFLRGAEDRCDVPYKTISEYVDKSTYADIPEIDREKYYSEIIEKVALGD